MFVVLVTYLQPLEVVDKYLVEHRSFLDQGYKTNSFVASGPQNPRTGGIIISQLKTRAEIESIIQRDPFYIHEVAEYEIIEFDPVKHHPDFATFL